MKPGYPKTREPANFQTRKPGFVTLQKPGFDGFSFWCQMAVFQCSGVCGRILQLVYSYLTTVDMLSHLLGCLRVSESVDKPSRSSRRQLIPNGWEEGTWATRPLPPRYRWPCTRHKRSVDRPSGHGVNEKSTYVEFFAALSTLHLLPIKICRNTLNSCDWYVH